MRLGPCLAPHLLTNNMHTQIPRVMFRVLGAHSLHRSFFMGPPNRIDQLSTSLERAFANHAPQGDPFAGMTTGSATKTALPRSPLDGLGNTGAGIARNRSDQPVLSGPLETASFRRSNDLLARAEAAGSHLPGDRFQAPRPTLNALAHRGSQHTHRPQHSSPTTTAGRTHEHLPPSPIREQRTARTDPHATFHPHMTLRGERNPHRPLDGTRPVVHMENTPQNPQQGVSPNNSGTRNVSRSERHTLVQAQIAGARGDLALARNELLTANNPLLRANTNDRQRHLDSAQGNFERAQHSLRALQANPNLTREERLEVSRLTRENDFRNMNRDIRDARFNLELDNI